MIILHIETSTDVCSVALSKNGECIFHQSNFEGMNHAELLSPFIQEALSTLSFQEQIDAVAVSSGPGSYTGLRIGVATAKGLCYGYKIPLIEVSTLRTMLMEVLKQKNRGMGLYCPMIDARRMEVFTVFFDSEGIQIENVKPKIITENSFCELLNEQTIYFFGNGSEKCKSLITHRNAHFIDNIFPLASNMMVEAEEKFTNNDFVDLAYFEPFYLKEFQTTQKKKLF